MSDDTSLRSPQDRTRVAMGQEHEVRYWTERFGVPREELQSAVDEVGNSVAAIETHLEARGADTRPQRGGEAETTRFGMEAGDNTEIPATGSSHQEA